MIAAALLAAAAVTFPLPRHADAVAYAPGRVIWSTAGGAGPVIVNAASPGGGAPQVLARIATAPGAIAVSLAANASGVAVAVRSGKDDKLVLIGADGAPRTLLDCHAPARESPPDLSVVAGRTGFAVGGARCGDGRDVRTVAADGTVTPVAGVLGTSALAYAE